MTRKAKRYYSLGSFASYMGQHKWRFGITLLCFVVSNLFLSVVPIFVGRLVGALSAHPVLGHQAIIYTWILIACSTGHDLTWRVSEYAFIKLVGPLGFRYENIMFRQVMQKPYPYFVDKFTGKLSSYINTISLEQRTLFDNLCFNYAGDIVGLMVLLVILTNVNWQTGVVFLGGVLGMFVVGRHSIRGSIRAEKHLADVGSTKNAKIVDAIANFVNVKSFRKEYAEIQSIAIEQDRTIKAFQSSQFWAVLFWATMSFFVRELIWPAALGLNVYLFLHGSISLAQLSVVVSSLLVFSNTVWQLVWNLSQLNLRVARVEEAHAYLFGKTNIVKEQNRAAQHTPTTPVFSQSLELRNLHFAYPDKKETKVLYDLNLAIKKGQKLGIVGRSGSGKSTITKLLLGYYDNADGQVLLDGKAVPVADVAELISYVPQDTTLFHRSVADNIAYASSRATTREQVVEAAKLAHAHEFIEKISDGYDALVGERGVKLSVGQRQRIAIARAFLDDKPLLILDEATSALDSESEVLVQEALENLWDTKTVIAIAHRLSTLRHMDVIAVMDNGRIIEQGSHQELLAAGGRYAKLWAHQSGGFIEE